MRGGNFPIEIKGNKGPLVCLIFAQGWRFNLILIFSQPHQQGAITKMRKDF